MKSIFFAALIGLATAAQGKQKFYQNSNFRTELNAFKNDIKTAVANSVANAKGAAT